MEKTTILDQTTFCSDGSVGIKLLKIIKDEDGRVLFSEPHRTVVDVLGSVDDQLASVNAHLAELGFPAVVEAASALIANLSQIQRNDPDVQARRAAVVLERAAMAEQSQESS